MRVGSSARAASRNLPRRRSQSRRPWCPYSRDRKPRIPLGLPLGGGGFAAAGGGLLGEVRGTWYVVGGTWWVDRLWDVGCGRWGVGSERWERRKTGFRRPRVAATNHKLQTTSYKPRATSYPPPSRLPASRPACRPRPGAHAVNDTNVRATRNGAYHEPQATSHRPLSKPPPRPPPKGRALSPFRGRRGASTPPLDGSRAPAFAGVTREVRDGGAT